MTESSFHCSYISDVTWVNKSVRALMLIGAMTLFASAALHAQDLLSAPAFRPHEYSPAITLKAPPMPAPVAYIERQCPGARPRGAVPPQHDVSWKLLPQNSLQDQKDMWITFPAHLFHGQHVLPTFSIIAVTGGLAADATVAFSV